MSAVVKVFGRLRDDPIHTRRRQAYEKRQWTKSREAGATTVRRGLGGFDRDADADENGWNVARRGRWGLQASDAVAVLEQAGTARNPSVLAQVLSK
jgi:hypothetical protein